MELAPFTYTLKRSRKRRTVALRVDPSGTVWVSAPFFAPRLWIDRVVQKHWSWVTRKKEQLANPAAARDFISGEPFPLWGENLSLDVQLQTPLKKPYCTREGDFLCVRLPASTPHKKPVIQQALRSWYTQHTAQKLSEGIDGWAARMGVRYQSFKVANQKSRWGSCSRQGHLRFNALLSLFTPAALEYVLVHELAHIREPNHSPRFWALVQSVIPDYKERRRMFRTSFLHRLF